MIGAAVMNDTGPVPPRAAFSKRRLAWAAGLLAAGAVGGGLIALSVPAAAENLSGVQAAATADPSQRPGHPGRDGGPGGSRAGETPLTGADADKAKAAALAAVPGATIDRVETDADGAVYEAHVTKSDGTRATVKMDKDFKVTGVETDQGRPGHPGGPRPTASPSPTS
jgi:hypothetical protein